MDTLVLGIEMILFGVFFVVAGLWAKREWENADEELIERHDLFGGGIYVTRERVYKGAVFALIVGIIFLLLGILTILTQRLFGILPPVP